MDLFELISFSREDNEDSIFFNSLSKTDFSLFKEFISRFGIDFSIFIMEASKLAFSSLKESTVESFSIFLLSKVVIIFLNLVISSSKFSNLSVEPCSLNAPNFLFL